MPNQISEHVESDAPSVARRGLSRRADFCLRGALTAAVLIAVPLLVVSTSQAATVSVTVDASGITPANITVEQGTTVTWTMASDSQHRITSINGPVSFDSGIVSSGGTWSFTFSTVGLVNYQDGEHGATAPWIGTITVITPVPTTSTTATTTTTTVAPPTTIGVQIFDNGFTPTMLNINVGDQVTWTNTGLARHSVFDVDFTWKSDTLFGGDAFAHTFTTPGSFAYYCGFHPEMRGTINVTGTAPPTTPPSTSAPPTTAAPTTTSPPPTTAAPTTTVPGTTSTGVQIVDFNFLPGDVTVNVGDQVTWTNTGSSAHTVVANGRSFASDLLTTGLTFSHTFPSPGTFAYFCDIHPQMTGTVTVIAAPGDPGPQATTPAATTTTTPTTTAPPVSVAGDIDIVDFSFTPSTITIKAGRTLTFANTGNAKHSATAKDGSFDTGLLARGQTARHKFNTPGTFPYFCVLHPGMTGTILVTDAARTTPPPAVVVTAAPTVPGEVQLRDFEFSPTKLTVQAGATVTFSDIGAASHSATATDGTWNTGIENPGDKVQLTFATPGTYSYYCLIHPAMTATLTVTAADGSAPAPAARVQAATPAPGVSDDGATASVNKTAASASPPREPGGHSWPTGTIVFVGFVLIASLFGARRAWQRPTTTTV